MNNDFVQNAYKTKQIGSQTFALAPLNVLDARTLQLKIGKVIGTPFIKFFGDGSAETDEEILVSGLSDALASIEPEESVALIKKLCELTMNQSKSAPTDYMRDFRADTSDDLELAFWVVEEVFGNFLVALSQSNLGAQAINLVSPQEQKETK